MHRAGLFVALSLLAGCATHPITGREQILALPAVQAAYADVSFAFSSGSPPFGASPACERDCGSARELEKLARRVAVIGTSLEASARVVDPELFERIEGFRIELNDGIGMGTGSSAGGRIVLGSGLAQLEPEDTVIAFLVAREMAHVIARHAEENSGSSIAFSALGMLLPGFNFLARFIASRLGSSVLTRSWAAQQQREADEIALVLLERSGIPVLRVARSLEHGINRARLPAGDWGARYLESSQRVAAIAAAAPGYAVIGG